MDLSVEVHFGRVFSVDQPQVDVGSELVMVDARAGAAGALRGRIQVVLVVGRAAAVGAFAANVILVRILL